MGCGGTKAILSKQKSIILAFFVFVKIRFCLECYPKKKNCASTFENLYLWCSQNIFFATLSLLNLLEVV